MKNRTIKTIALLLTGVMMVVCIPNATAQGGDEAKAVLRQAREKCQSIQGGHYEMLEKMKYMSGNDTIITC